MRRLSILALVLTATFISACSNKGQRISIQKDADNETVQKNGKSARSNDLFGEGECLNLDNVKKFLHERKTGMITLYTSDLDIGNYTSIGDGSRRAFTPLIPTAETAALKAKVLLCGGQKPVYKDIQGKDLPHGFNLLGDKQENCATVTSGKTVFEVTTKSLRYLGLKNKEGTEIREYTVRGGNRLEVTIYRAGSTEIEGAGWLKQAYTIRWGAGQDQIALPRRFSTFLKDTVNTPAEFEALLDPTVNTTAAPTSTPPKGKRQRVKGYAQQANSSVKNDRTLIAVGGSMYSHIVRQIQAGDLKNACK